jgi:hypothetical protein
MMADATLRDIIERLKAEGQLTRNTGTNSIKSIKETIVKSFDGISLILSETLKLKRVSLEVLYDLDKNLENKSLEIFLDSTIDSISKSTVDSISKSTIDSISKSTVDSISKSNMELMVDSISKSTIDSTSKSTIDSTIDSKKEFQVIIEAHQKSTEFLHRQIGDVVSVLHTQFEPIKNYIQTIDSVEDRVIRNIKEYPRKSTKEDIVLIQDTLLDQNNMLKLLLEVNQQSYNDQKNREKTESVGKSVIEPRSALSKKTSLDNQVKEVEDIFSGVLGRLGSLGLLAGTAATAIGGAIGIFKGQIRAINIFFPNIFTNTRKVFTGFVAGITNVFATAAASIRGALLGASMSVIRVFDDMTSFVRTTFAGASQSMIGKAITSVVVSLARLARPFIDLTSLIGDIIRGPVSNVFSSFANIFDGIRRFGATIAGVARLVSRVFLPLTIVMTAFDTIREALAGFEEGGILGGLEGAVNGFVTSLITLPLDFVTNMAAWIVEKLGFDAAASYLREFSFTDLWIRFTRTMFSGISAAFEWIQTLFTNPVEALRQLWDATTGGISDLGSWLWSKVEGVWNWMKDLFGNLTSMLPSIEDIQVAFLDIMPEWMRRLVGAPGRSAATIIDEQMETQSQQLAVARERLESGTYLTSSGRRQDEDLVERLSSLLETEDPRRAMIQSQIESLRQERQSYIDSTAMSSIEPDTSFWDNQIARFEAELRSFRSGTRGFMDFGLGTPSILHGIEAVVPRNTLAGELLDKLFDDDWNRVTPTQQVTSQVLSEINRFATSQQMQPIIINHAPVTNMPVNNITGGTNISNQSMTSIRGGGGSGLGRFAN